MRYIDNAPGGMTALKSRTTFVHLLAQHGFLDNVEPIRIQSPDFTQVNADACVQDALMHPEWHLESRRRLMLPHCFLHVYYSPRTRASGTSTGGEFSKSLWMPCLRIGSGAQLPVASPQVTGSTSSETAHYGNVTARTSCASGQILGRGTAVVSLDDRLPRARLNDRSRRCP